MVKGFHKAWKIYGAEGHRQRESFFPSKFFDFSENEKIKMISVLNADLTNTNEFSVLAITANTEKDCDTCFVGQIDDGIFENSAVGGWSVLVADSVDNGRCE